LNPWAKTGKWKLVKGEQNTNYRNDDVDVEDDGLFRGNDVVKQAEEKHGIVSFYAKLFPRG
jgi:hypothetical protein